MYGCLWLFCLEFYLLDCLCFRCCLVDALILCACWGGWFTALLLGVFICRGVCGFAETWVLCCMGAVGSALYCLFVYIPVYCCGLLRCYY